MRTSVWSLMLLLSVSAMVLAEPTAYPSGSKERPPFEVPPAYGYVTDYDPGTLWKKNQQTIVMIQDLHANVGVQKNIAAVLYRLNRVNNKPSGLLVCVEGASGEGDVSLLRSLPRPLRKGFESMLLRRAYLTGAELAATEAAADIHQQQNVIWRKVKDFFGFGSGPAPVSLSPIRLWGVDDPDLYRKNWKAAKFVDKYNHDAIDYVKALRSSTAASADQRAQMDLLTKMLLLRMQPSEYKQYLKGRALNPKVSPAVQKVVEAAETYYEAADLRSIAMVDNVLKKMGSDTGYSALISGGFHTAEMAAIFKQKGLRYIVVTPDVRTLDQDQAYKARLREEE